MSTRVLVNRGSTLIGYELPMTKEEFLVSFPGARSVRALNNHVCIQIYFSLASCV